MLIFLCRRLSGKEKTESSLRLLRLCGEDFYPVPRFAPYRPTGRQNDEDSLGKMKCRCYDTNNRKNE